MKEIIVNNKTYKLEFSIEASLCDECVEKVIDLIAGFGNAENSSIADISKTISNLPKQTLTMFYASLLENHGNEIKSTDDAKTILKTYIKDNNSSFYDVLTMLIECMSDDGFFKQIGLEQMTEASQTIQPQDHKKKSRK